MKTKSLTQTPRSAKTPGSGFFTSFPAKTVPFWYAFNRKTAENSLPAGVLPVNGGFGSGSKIGRFLTRFDFVREKGQAVIAAALLAGVFLATPPLYAQVLNPVCSTTPQATICTEPSNQTPDDNRLFGPNGVLTKIINLLSIILGIISVFVIIIAGVRYITSSGDSSSVNGAKNTLLYAVISLAIAALAQGIIVFVLKKL